MRLSRKYPALGAFLIASTALAAEPAIVTARRLAREAQAAHAAGNEKAYLAGMEKAVELRADYPRFLVDLAIAQAANGQPDLAVATLGRLADLGTTSPVDREAGLAALRERADFKAVAARIGANGRSAGKGEVAFTLAQVTGLIEGIAWREKTGEFYFGDVHNRAIWVRPQTGSIRRLTQPDPALGGVFGLAIDEARGVAWAATSPVAAMSGYKKEEGNPPAGIAEIDLATGGIRRVIALPDDKAAHVLGDLTLGPGGSVYTTDSIVGAIWRLAPGGTALEKFIESDEFISLQGLAFSVDGSTLYVADYLNGLLRVDVAGKSVARMPSPPGTTLVGIDGLYAAPDGRLFAVQNGTRPLRVVRITVSPAAVEKVEVVESGHLSMGEPSLGTIAAGNFYFIGNAGWSRFESDPAVPTAPRSVPIYRTGL